MKEPTIGVWLTQAVVFVLALCVQVVGFLNLFFSFSVWSALLKGFEHEGREKRWSIKKKKGKTNGLVAPCVPKVFSVVLKVFSVVLKVFNVVCSGMFLGTIVYARSILLMRTKV